MTTAPSTTDAPRTPLRRAPGGRVRAGQIVLTVLLVLVATVAASTAFSDDPFPGPAIVLIASFGLLAVAFGLVVTWSTPISRAARLAVWALPLFFVWHVAALQTWLPDAVFAVVAAVGAILATSVRRRAAEEQ